MPDREILPEGCQHFPTGRWMMHCVQADFKSLSWSNSVIGQSRFNGSEFQSWFDHARPAGTLNLNGLISSRHLHFLQVAAVDGLSFSSTRVRKDGR